MPPPAAYLPSKGQSQTPPSRTYYPPPLHSAWWCMMAAAKYWCLILSGQISGSIPLHPVLNSPPKEHDPDVSISQKHVLRTPRLLTCFPPNLFRIGAKQIRKTNLLRRNSSCRHWSCCWSRAINSTYPLELTSYDDPAKHGGRGIRCCFICANRKRCIFCCCVLSVVLTVRNLHHNSRNLKRPDKTMFQYAIAMSRSETRHANNIWPFIRISLENVWHLNRNVIHSKQHFWNYFSPDFWQLFFPQIDSHDDTYIKKPRLAASRRLKTGVLDRWGSTCCVGSHLPKPFCPGFLA